MKTFINIDQVKDDLAGIEVAFDDMETVIQTEYISMKVEETGEVLDIGISMYKTGDLHCISVIGISNSLVERVMEFRDSDSDILDNLKAMGLGNISIEIFEDNCNMFFISDANIIEMKEVYVSMKGFNISIRDMVEEGGNSI